MDQEKIQDDIELKKKGILYALILLLIYQKVKYELLINIQEASLTQFRNRDFDWLFQLYY